MSEPDMTPLCEATLEQIGIEMEKRFRDFIFIGYNANTGLTHGESRGSKAMVLGLMEQHKADLLSQWLSSEYLGSEDVP